MSTGLAVKENVWDTGQAESSEPEDTCFKNAAETQLLGCYRAGPQVQDYQACQLVSCYLLFYILLSDAGAFLLCQLGSKYVLPVEGTTGSLNGPRWA